MMQCDPNRDAVRSEPAVRFSSYTEKNGYIIRPIEDYYLIPTYLEAVCI